MSYYADACDFRLWKNREKSGTACAWIWHGGFGGRSVFDIRDGSNKRVPNW